MFAEDKVTRHTKVHILYHIADYVDAAAIGGKLMSLPGEVFVTMRGIAKKSAEVIVLIGYEPTLLRKSG